MREENVSSGYSQEVIMVLNDGRRDGRAAIVGLLHAS